MWTKSPTLIITNNTVPSRKHTSKTMPTKKAPRKETGRPPKKSSVASSAAAAERDPAVTIPPPPKERVKQRDSSLFFLTQSAICKSHQKSLLQSNVEYRGNWGGNNFSYTFRTSSDKTLDKGGHSETNQCSAR